MNMQQWSEEIRSSKKRRAFPLMNYVGLELMGMRISDVIKDGECQAQCVKAITSRYPSAACMTQMDLSVESEMFGSEVRYADSEVPSVTGIIVDGMDAAKALEIPVVGAGRSSAYLSAAFLLAAEIADRPVFGCHIGPFSLAGRLCGMSDILVNIRKEPETIHTVLEKCTDFLVKYAQAYKKTGVNGLIIAEPAAGLLSLAQCVMFSSSYVSRIVSKVQDDYFMVILHNCGNTKKIVPSMLSTGVMGIHLGNAVEMSSILRQVPNHIITFGNLDPMVFRNGSDHEIRKSTIELLNNMASYSNFVLSSGCDIPLGTPAKNIDEFFEALHDHNNAANNRC